MDARRAEDAEDAAPGRFWSVRRVPAALAALIVLAAAGLLLYDIAAVRADRPAMRWRRALAEDLATLRLDETPVLAGAGAAVVLGVWLIALALTPGLRAVLPMRRVEGIVRAGLDRDAAARMLRDRATEVAGVQSARVRVGRTSISVRARSHFRELDEVRADLDAVLDAGLRELGLAVRPDLSVYVDRPSARNAR
nr:DUF6286 domain-containing protein [Streptomyces sp. PR69]